MVESCMEYLENLGMPHGINIRINVVGLLNLLKFGIIGWLSKIIAWTVLANKIVEHANYYWKCFEMYLQLLNSVWHHRIKTFDNLLKIIFF